MPLPSDDRAAAYCVRRWFAAGFTAQQIRCRDALVSTDGTDLARHGVVVVTIQLQNWGVRVAGACTGTR
jgi:hypothetical protein